MADERDLLLYNTRIYTLDQNRPTASALFIRGDRILALGDGADLGNAIAPGTRRLNLDGGIVIPGLTDAHIHLAHYARGLQKSDCETKTHAECIERIAEGVSKLQPGEWLLGHGWNQNDWPEGFGSTAELDAVAPNNPVYLTAKSLHAAWANSLALHQAKIDAETPDPPGGRLGRFPDGKPDGLLFEGAMEMVSNVLPEWTIEQLAEAIQAAQPHLLRLGLTGVHDFDRRSCFAALQILHQRGELKLRVVKNIPVDDLPYATGLGLRFGFGDAHLRMGGVKLFADGALGPHTAAMLTPYEDDPANRGMLLMDAEEIFELGCQAVDNGLPMTIHAIGDLANHEVLNAYQQLRAYELSRHSGIEQQLRHRIEHVQLLHEQDVPRLAELGIIASMQPIHATSDMMMADRYWGQRSSLGYAFGTQLKKGAVLAFGSDAPVESPNPFCGLHAAVTRRRSDGSPGEGGWYPEQRLSVEDALRAYTHGPAYAAGMESQLGILAPGFFADLLVLDVDPFTCPTEELYKIRPRATMVSGAWEFSGS